MYLKKLLILILILLVPFVSGQPNVVFESDWSTALGNSNDALLDTDKVLPWTGKKDDSGGTQVVTVSSTGRAWPAGMSNVLQIWNLAASSSVQGVRNSDRIAPLAVGGNMSWRVYISKETPDSYTGGFNHPFQNGDAGGGLDRAWTLRHYTANSAPGMYRVALFVTSADEVLGGGTQKQRWELGPPSSGSGSIELSKGVVYGFEVRMITIDSDSWRPSMRVYDVDGNILYNDSDWYRANGNGDTLADAVGIFGLRDINGTNDLQVGSNGWSTDPASDFVDSYWGGVAICLNDWCGPYGGNTNCNDEDTRSCGSDVGVCSSGIETCNGGSWGSCVGEVTGSAEICDDTLDNDCDGTTDCSDSDCTSDPACAPSNFCGDSTCDAGETCSSCPADCVVCPPNNNPGDINGDLMVDLNDLIMMTVNLGNSGFDPATDINNDGIVNIFDMVVVARNYGNDYTTPAPTGLVAYYDFNEGSGNVLTDLSGNDNTGNIIGNPIWATGQTGTALNFDGTNDYIDIPHSTSLDITDEITLMAWINTPGDAYDNIIVKGSLGTAYALFLNNLSIEYNLGSYIPALQTISANTWTHIALTYDGNNVRIYRDGIEVFSNPRIGAIGTNTQLLQIGANVGGSSLFIGLIDDVRIYNRALTQTEIQTDMNN